MGKWGFLRETSDIAKKAGIDKDTGIHRTGLDEYLKIIFPTIDDWVHDKTTGLKDRDGKKRRLRPDYRSEKLKIIIEFDGLPHYRRPDACIKDIENKKFFEGHGYKVVRIPYFIQLTNKVVKQMFNVDVEEPLFDETVPSLGIKGCNTPAFLCPAGIKRMAEDFINYPEQLEINIDYLKKCNNDYYTGYDLLLKEIKRIKSAKNL